MSDTSRVITNVLIIGSLIAAIIIAFTERYAHATYFMSNAIFLQLLLGER